MSRPRGTHQSDPAFKQIARHIANDIAAGRLRDGERLASTRDLAQEWGVSAFTVNAAMDSLAKDGLVVSRGRSGRVVHAPDAATQMERRVEQPSTPRVLLIGGFAGSGKTELGRMIARETGWAMLDKDTLTRPVVEAALELLGRSPNDRDSDLYVESVRPREYEALAAAMDENLQCGNSIIATAPFIREFGNKAWLSRTQASCAEHGAAVQVAWVYCDPETMHSYLRRRGAARDASKLADWPSYLNAIDPELRPATPHFLVDNSVDSEPLRDQAQRLIATTMQKEK